MKKLALAALLLCPVPAAQAKLKTPEFTAKQVEAGSSERVLRLKVEAEYDGMTHSADFLIENGNQCNFVQGGEKAFPVETKAGKGLEYKKWGFIFNALPVEDTGAPDRVTLQMQVEITGPAQGKDGVEVKTWQLQTMVHLVKGKPKTVARGSGKAVVTVTDDTDGD